MSGNNPAPDRWREYSNMNDVIEGTRFLPFKTPFKGRMAPTKKFDVRDLLREVGNLGLVVNLVKTTRYYNSSTYADEDVEYLHIPLHGGGRVPSDDEIERVFRHIDRFIDKNARDNEKLIGVHCTHGVNRTGYVICRYMIRKLGFEAEEAIEKFETARGHKFDHEEYVEALLLLKPNRDPSVAKWHSVGGRIQPSDKKEEELELDFDRLKELRARKTFSSVPSYVETRDGRIPPPGSNLQDGARTENQERGDFDRDRKRHSSSSSSRSRRERRSRSPLRNRRSDRRPSYAETHEEDTHPSDRYWRYVGPRNPRERYNWPERYVGPRRGEREHGY